MSVSDQESVLDDEFIRREPDGSEHTASRMDPEDALVEPTDHLARPMTTMTENVLAILKSEDLDSILMVRQFVFWAMLDAKDLLKLVDDWLEPKINEAEGFELKTDSYIVTTETKTYAKREYVKVRSRKT